MFRSICRRLAYFFAWLADVQPGRRQRDGGDFWTAAELRERIKADREQNRFNLDYMQQHLDASTRENIALRLELDSRDQTKH